MNKKAKSILFFSLIALILVSFAIYLVSATPVLTIVLPIAGANLTTTIPVLNVSSDYTTNCTYSIDGSAFSALGPDIDVSHQTSAIDIHLLSDADHTITIFCMNDSDVTDNSTATRTFTKDATFPLISVVYPAVDGLLFNSQIGINYTISDLHPQSCWWTNNTGLSNHTIACGTNITGQTWIQGSNTVVISINDSAGNLNLTTRQFNIDTSSPVVNLITPANGTSYQSSSNFLFNCTVTDNLALSNITLYVWNSTGSPINTTTTAVSGTSNYSAMNVMLIPNEAYSWNCQAGDTASNYAFNSTNNTLTIDVVPAVINSIAITSPDNFVAALNGAESPNANVSLAVNVTDALSGVAFVRANISQIVPGAALVNLALSGNGLWSGNVTINDTSMYNFVPGNITIVAADNAGNGASGNNVVVVVLYNMTTPPQMPLGCQRFGNLTTNFANVLNFSSVNFIIQIEMNGSCLTGPGNGTSPWDGYQQVMMMNFSSLNMANQSVGAKLAGLKDALQVNITPPHAFGLTRIYVNETAFAELNTNTTITLNNIPFASKPSILADNISRSVGVPTWTNNTPFNITVTSPVPMNILVPNGNLQFTVEGFSGYNETDNLKPLITINSPAATSTSNAVLVNVTVNGTITQPTQIIITGLGTTYTYNSTYNSANCTEISTGSDTYNCLISTTLPDASYTLNVLAYDYGGSDPNGPGNSNSTSLAFVVDAVNPQLTVSSPANGTWFNSSSVAFTFTATDNLNGPGFVCDVYLDQAVFDTINISDIHMNVSATNISTINNLVDGLHNYTIACFDDVNNQNSSATRFFNVDTTKPAPAITSPAANANLSSKLILINTTVTETNWNYTIITVSNSSFTNSTTNTTSKSVNTSLSVPADGAYSVYVTAYDLAGNSNTTSRNVTVDTTAPVITVYSPLNNSVYYINQSISIYFARSDLTAGSMWYNYNGTTNISSIVANSISTNINYTTNGTNTIILYANDTLNQLSTVVISINVYPLNSTSFIVNDTTYNVTSNITTIVVPYNSSIQNVTLTNTSQVVSMDLSQSLNSGNITLGSNSFNLVTQGTYNYTATIPNGTVISGGAGWDGKITLPFINTSSFTAPSSGTANVIVDMGSSVELNFSQPVEIIIGGMSGKHAAWSRGSATLNDISLACDNITAPTNIAANGTRECYGNSGSDLVIWTYHFTSYAAYTPSTTTPPAAAPSSGGGLITTWTCAEWSVCVNGTQTRTCSKVNPLLYAPNKPAESQACTVTTPTTTPQGNVTTPTTTNATEEQTEGAAEQKAETKIGGIIIVAVILAIIVFVIVKAIRPKNLHHIIHHK